MNFGQRMAKERRKEIDRLYHRLNGALKKRTEKLVWNVEMDKQVTGAVRNLQQMGWKAELRYEEGQVKVYAVEYVYA